MLLSKIASVIAGESSIREDLDIRRFSTDTRTLSGRPYELFVAVNGKRDGHDFIAEALDKGVKNFLIEKDINIGGCNSVRVENSIQALQAIAKVIGKGLISQLLELLEVMERLPLRNGWRSCYQKSTLL